LRREKKTRSPFGKRRSSVEKRATDRKRVVNACWKKAKKMGFRAKG